MGVRLALRGAFVSSLLLAALAPAHDLSLSSVHLIRRARDAVVAVTVHRRKVGAEPVDRFVRQRLRLVVDGRRFDPSKAHVVDDRAADVVVWQAAVAPGRTFALEARLFPEDPATRTVATVVRDGRVEAEAVLDADHPAWREGEGPGALGFLRLGVGHILSGADHVLFVLGLVLLGGGLRSLLRIVTAFTLAHSLTLSLAATGVWAPPGRVVEPLIALSIVAAGAENLRRPGAGRDYRPLVAFGFGLVHGFGFAGALGDLGLGGASLLTALLLFNVGVEVGQASLVGLASPLVALVSRRWPEGWRRASAVGSVAIVLIGAYWFGERAAGG